MLLLPRARYVRTLRRKAIATARPKIACAQNAPRTKLTTIVRNARATEAVATPIMPRVHVIL